MRQDDLTPHHAWDDVEGRLRAALHHRATQASPDYRLDTILSRSISSRTSATTCG
ncbi:MAG: hypothetical protein LC679_13540 [Intrasporangiaceae bacterium]|nr:hypothetical protein [Intrasporangiaceae bacterium]